MDTVLFHARMTAAQIALGFAIGAGSALLLALAFDLSRPLRSALEPYLLLSQLLPKVALAPLFIIWFGFGMQPKVIIAALVCFFPTFINAVQGLRAYDRDMGLMMKCLRAGRLTTLLRLRLPFAVPYITAGLKSSALLSVTGCVVGEFIGADRGLGFLLLRSEAQLDTPLLFAALASLAALGAAFYSVPVILERTLLRKYMPAHAAQAGLAAVPE